MPIKYNTYIGNFEVKYDKMHDKWCNNCSNKGRIPPGWHDEKALIFTQAAKQRWMYWARTVKFNWPFTLYMELLFEKFTWCPLYDQKVVEVCHPYITDILHRLPTVLRSLAKRCINHVISSCKMIFKDNLLNNKINYHVLSCEISPDFSPIGLQPCTLFGLRTLHLYASHKKGKKVNEHPPIKSIEHFYCNQYWQGHSHGMEVAKYVAINTNKACRIGCALHVMCLSNTKQNN